MLKVNLLRLLLTIFLFGVVSLVLLPISAWADLYCGAGQTCPDGTTRRPVRVTGCHNGPGTPPLYCADTIVDTTPYSCNANAPPPSYSCGFSYPTGTCEWAYDGNCADNHTAFSDWYDCCPGVPEPEPSPTPPPGGGPSPTPSPSATPSPTPFDNPIGFQDPLQCSLLRGWAGDPNQLSTPINVHLYIDGPAGSGTLLGAPNAGLEGYSQVDAQDQCNMLCPQGGCFCSSCQGLASDPAWCKHRYSYSLTPAQSTTYNNGANHQVYAYGINVGAGNNAELFPLGGLNYNCPAPPPVPVCTSWTEVHINDCDDFNKFNDPLGDPDCETTSPTVTVNQTGLNGPFIQMRHINVDFSVDCNTLTGNEPDWVTDTFSPTKPNWSLITPPATGDKKVCVQLSNANGWGTPCGGGIHLVAPPLCGVEWQCSKENPGQSISFRPNDPSLCNANPIASETECASGCVGGEPAPGEVNCVCPVDNACCSQAVGNAHIDIGNNESFCPVKAKAVFVDSVQNTCTDIWNSGTPMNQTIFSLTPIPPTSPVPANATQNGGAYVFWNKAPWQTLAQSYTLGVTPPTGYSFQRMCLTRDDSLGGTFFVGENSSYSLNPIYGLTWDVGLSYLGGWFLGRGGSVHTNSGIALTIPSGEIFLAHQNPNVRSVGIVSWDTTSTITSAQMAANGYRVDDMAHPNEPPSYYTFFSDKYPMPLPTHTGGGKPTSSGVWLHDGDLDTVGNWTVTSTQSYVIFVDGKLTINGEIDVEQGGFIAFVVNGGIDVATTVGFDSTAYHDTPGSPNLYPNPNIAGLYFTDGAFTTLEGPGGNRQLVAAGTFVADSFILNRTLLVDNIDSAAEMFLYRPDLWINAPPEFSETDITWQEVAP